MVERCRGNKTKCSFGNRQSLFLPLFVSPALFYISYCHSGETSLHLTLEGDHQVFNLYTTSKFISYKYPYQHNIYRRG